MKYSDGIKRNSWIVPAASIPVYCISQPPLLELGTILSLTREAEIRTANQKFLLNVIPESFSNLKQRNIVVVTTLQNEDSGEIFLLPMALLKYLQLRPVCPEL